MKTTMTQLLLLWTLFGLPFQAHAHFHKAFRETSSFCSAANKPGELCIINISNLHPTQFTIGMILIREKQQQISSLKNNESELNKYLKKKAFPVVISPQGQFYIVDHHHLARALYEEKIETTYAAILENFDEMSEEEFQKEMAKNGWFFPFDEKGKGPHPWSDLPLQVQQLKDDPYRSLSGKVRDRGGYEKTEFFYTEAIWANFFRSRIQLGNTPEDFENAILQAIPLAHSSEAEDLPGYIAWNQPLLLKSL